MTYERILRKKVVSADGKTVAESISRVTVSDGTGKTNQSVSTRVSSSGSKSSASSSSTSSSSISSSS